MTPLQAGEPVPDFTLPDDTGGMVELSALRGKPFVLFVYPRDGTQSCTMEAKAFSSLSSQFRAAGVPLMGLSPDSVEKHRRFKDAAKLDLRLLSDPEHRVIKSWGCWGEKVQFGRRYMGVIRSTFLVDSDGTLARAWTVTRVAGHAEAVLEAALGVV